jgi:hypothetical protein
MINSVEKVSDINRLDCRKHVEKRFDAPRMAGDYLEAYDLVLTGSTAPLTTVR